MKLLTSLIGRGLFALPFAVFGIFHLTSAQNMAGVVPGWIPGGVIWVYLTGVAMIVASTLILINREAKLAAFGLAAMLLVFVFTVHLPGLSQPDTNAMMVSMISLLKDLSMAGGALLIAGSAGPKR